jgi:hypothetical protein
MLIKQYSKDDKDIWNRFILESKNGFFMFDRHYMDYHSDRFVDNSLMFYDEKDNLIAVFPANIDNGVLHSHQGLSFGGVISTNNIRSFQMLNVFDLLREYCQKNSIKEVIYKAIPKIYHKQPADEDLYALFRNDAICFRSDLSTTINLRDKIGFNSLRKRNIKKAIKNNITVKESNDIKSFYKILYFILGKYHDVKPVHTEEELGLLKSSFPDNMKLYLALDADEAPLAGALIFETDLTIHGQYTVSSDEGRNCGALDIIYDYLISDVYKDKDYFDLGVSTEKDGHFLNEGLIAQKEGFGGRGVLFNQYKLKL